MKGWHGMAAALARRFGTPQGATQGKISSGVVQHLAELDWIGCQRRFRCSDIFSISLDSQLVLNGPWILWF